MVAGVRQPGSRSAVASSGVRGGDARKKGTNRGDGKKLKQKKKEGGERLSGRGVSRQGRGENKGLRKITILPFPSLFHLFDPRVVDT